MEMKNPLADIPATGSVAPGTTDLERRVASSEHASGGDMGDTGAGDVRVAERHGIWTVSAAGHFLGDYLDEEAALAAAAQARGRGEDGGAADPWQRAEADARP
jgi:hypothetical protein